MEAAAIGDGSPSTTLPNTDTLATVSQFHRSAVKRKYGCRQNSVTLAESHENADTETDAAHRFEENKTVLQFRSLPPGTKM